MDRRQFAWTLAAASSVWPLAGRAAALTETDAAAGVRAALERGAVAAVGLLGRTDGFLGNPKVRIPLPGALEDAAGLLRATGQGKRVDELVTAMNRAAEAAVPEARTLLVSAAKSISVEDALDIVRGGDTSVTDFFARKTREPLGVKFLPIVTKATEKVKLANRYNAVAGKASRFGLIRQEDANVQQYVTAKALDGLYLMIGEEEKKIRADPVGTGSAILRKVFSL
ncbi:DUF4197 domain-containing protein [Rubrivivax benzoatilyticus]|uniref:DUF4197 domain-containing protein n=1 Tax=Rubrivivax benzoatilyticus TaxID=316997 RepID=A0ABX0HZV9_9BURK|nr:DUF4197 domain-containing protein [Rubrivivax benzoatilyticus]NHL00114.1 DUF4197 domain-containing protein [Rubrivivax benzoatilyticus]NHL25870.1 DUF4197 domain-containing protein [Rubrivivax benzoatilyticus]